MRSCIQREFDINTGDVVPVFDPILLRDKRLRKLMRTIKDGEGEEVEVNEEFFDNLLPDFGIALMNAYNSASNLTTEETIEIPNKVEVPDEVEENQESKSE